MNSRNRSIGNGNPTQVNTTVCNAPVITQLRGPPILGYPPGGYEYRHSWSYKLCRDCDTPNNAIIDLRPTILELNRACITAIKNSG